MGEEEKKEEGKKEEVKKPEEEKKEEAKAEKPKEEKKEESKDSKDPPPPSDETVVRVYMHCEGCAKRIRNSLKKLEGVEDVRTNVQTSMVVVKGENADPLKVLDTVQQKFSHRQVDLLTPIPKPAEKKVEENKEKAKPEEKKPEPQVIIVVLQVYMHCEACAQVIKRRIQRMSGVESAEPDLKSSQVTVKGVFDPPTLVEFIYKKTGKRAVILKQEPEKKEEKAKENADKDKGGEGEKKEKKEEAAKPAEEETKVEVKKDEFLISPSLYNLPKYGMEYPYYFPQPPKYPMEYPYYVQQPKYPMMEYPYYVQQPKSAMECPYHIQPYPPPQIFSDENPNACSIM